VNENGFFMRTIFTVSLIFIFGSFTFSLNNPTFTSQKMTHYIGEEFQDGVVFFVYLGTDGVEHGLVVAKEEQALTRWQNRASLVGSNSMADGKSNSLKINASPAITYVHHFGEGWYLPSINELGLLWRTREKVDTNLSISGQVLSKTVYWSSTEHAALSALGFDFNGGYSGDPSFKTNHYTVRAIKSF
jgi:hypothetical protein